MARSPREEVHDRRSGRRRKKTLQGAAYEKELNSKKYTYDPSDSDEDDEYNNFPEARTKGNSRSNKVVTQRSDDEEDGFMDDDDDEEKLSDYSSSDDDDGGKEDDPDDPPLKRQKANDGRAATTPTQRAKLIIAQAAQFVTYEKKQLLKELFVNKNVHCITVDKGVIAVIHSGTLYLADAGEEEDDVYHQQILGHAGGLRPGSQPTRVHIPSDLFGKTTTIKGVKAEVVDLFYSDSTRKKKAVPVALTTKAESLVTYSDVLLLHFVPLEFVEWLGETKRTPYDLYSHVLAFLRTIEDQQLQEACTTACQPLLNWCLCACSKAKMESKDVLTKLPKAISPVMDISDSGGEQLKARLVSTGRLPQTASHPQSGHAPATSPRELAEAAAAAAAAAVSKQLQTTIQPKGKKASDDGPEKKGWTQDQMELIMDFCNVDNWKDVPPIWDEIEGKNSTQEVQRILRRAMSEEAALFGVKLKTFHLSTNRIKQIMKVELSPGPKADVTDLKEGIVILDLVPRTRAEAAALSTQEEAERESERNRSLEESTTIASRRSKNVGAVPDSLATAGPTLTAYVIFIRVLFGRKCEHFKMVRKAKHIVDEWEEEDVTAEMIKNLFWAIIVDARQFFAAWNDNPDGTPKSNLALLLAHYEANIYLPLTSLPQSWRTASPSAPYSGRGKGRGDDGDRTSPGGGGRLRDAEAEGKKAWKNEDMHPMIEAEVRKLNETFKTITLNKLLQEGDREMNEVPKLTKGSQQDCLGFVMGRCNVAKRTGKCNRHHPKRREISDTSAQAFCTFIRPCVSGMLERKEKYANQLK